MKRNFIILLIGFMIIYTVFLNDEVDRVSNPPESSLPSYSQEEANKTNNSNDISKEDSSNDWDNIKEEVEEVELYEGQITVDSHNDTMMKVIDEETWLPLVDIGQDTDFHIDIGKMKAGNLNVGFFAAYTSDYYGKPERSLSRTLALINALYWTEKNNEDEFRIAKTYDEIHNTLIEGKIAAVPAIEGGYSITEENALELLMQYHNLGIKSFAFNWNYSNALGEGAAGTYADKAASKSSGGLTKLGKTTVRRMNDLGMIVDVSHMNERTFWDVIETSKAPIIASHSGVYSVRPHRRNLKDDQLLAIKDNGGLAAMVMYRDFVKNLKDAYIKDFVDHIDYAVNLIGIDHVGIGSDFDGAELPFDMKDASELYKIREELLKRNYSKEGIEKLLGKNTLRIVKEVEDLANDNLEANDIEISPDFKMGEVINTRRPLLTAKVEGDIDKSSIRVIVDGIAYKADLSQEKSTISLDFKNELNERFHVLTFEAKNKDGESKRETIIFYIEN